MFIGRLSGRRDLRDGPVFPPLSLVSWPLLLLVKNDLMFFCSFFFFLSYDDPDHFL